MLSKIKRTFGFINNHPLAKKNKLLAYRKFLSWQLQSLNANKFYIKEFIGSIKFYAKKSLAGVTGNIYTGLHEFNDMGFTLHFLRAQDSFFDIGANVGSYSLLASGHVGSTSLTFEPVPTTYELLERNITLNNLGNKVFLHNCAIGAATSMIKFTTTEDTCNHAILNIEQDTETIEVKVVPLDNFSECNPLLIKIDVEGFEMEVIKGGIQTLKNASLQAIIIELNGSGERYGYNDIAIHNHLMSLNFKPYTYDPLKRTFKQLDIFGNHNTIYIRDIEFVKQRCMEANPIAIFGSKF